MEVKLVKFLCVLVIVCSSCESIIKKKIVSKPLVPNLTVLPVDIINDNFTRLDSKHQVIFERLLEDSSGQGFILTSDSAKVFSQYWIIKLESDDFSDIEDKLAEYGGVITCENGTEYFVVQNLVTREFFVGSMISVGESDFLTISYEYSRDINPDNW
tara:strand:+ start:908 stop:1378 length:471 start_codon:yes stop_codon:yes gene_type:complete